MFKYLIKELNNLSTKNRNITFLILSVSLVFSLISGSISLIKNIQSVETFNIAIQFLQASILFFMLGIIIGILLNLIEKKKN